MSVPVSDLTHRDVDTPAFGGYSVAESKRCTKCGQVKPLSEFHRNRARPDGHQKYCKLCLNELQRRRTAVPLLAMPGLTIHPGEGVRSPHLAEVAAPTTLPTSPAAADDVSREARTQARTQVRTDVRVSESTAAPVATPVAPPVATPVAPPAATPAAALSAERMSLRDFLTLEHSPAAWVCPALAVMLTSDCQVRILTPTGNGPQWSVPLSGVEYICDLLTRLAGVPLGEGTLYF